MVSKIPPHLHNTVTIRLYLIIMPLMYSLDYNCYYPMILTLSNIQCLLVNANFKCPSQNSMYTTWLYWWQILCWLYYNNARLNYNADENLNYLETMWRNIYTLTCRVFKFYLGYGWVHTLGDSLNNKLTNYYKFMWYIYIIYHTLPNI